MENHSIYREISMRTGGDIYIGEPDIIGLNPKLDQRAEDFVQFFYVRR